MISKIPTYVKEISVDHVENLEEAEKIKSDLEEKFKYAKVSVHEIGPVIGAHIGPKSIGICSIW